MASTKEALVELIRANGYDLFTACELATDCLAEFKQSGEESERYHIGGTSFVLTRPRRGWTTPTPSE